MRRAEPVVRSELERRCEEVLHYVWDPIGVSGEPGARDEYVVYVPHVCGLLRTGATEKEVVAYLDSAVGEAMGLQPDSGRTAKAARVLIDWRDWLNETPLTEADFWIQLEFRLCREFDGYEQWRNVGLWCDGIYQEC
jgi:predicted RNase H-like HicB family nuclease